jgi:hypothetical protein
MQGVLSEIGHITAEAPTATGTSTIDSAAVDMAGWDGAICICKIGSIATNNNLRARQDDASGGSYADLAGSKVGDSASATPFVLDIRRPIKRYLKFRVTRGTTTTIDTLVVIKYRGRTSNFSQPTNTSVVRLFAPAEGTA